MKTIEEKAKAYDEARELAKQIAVQGGASRYLVTQIFPELKESEDERIRKCICMALTDVDEQRFKDFGTTLKDCLAYLEKQKEQKNKDTENFIHYLPKAELPKDFGVAKDNCKGAHLVLDEKKPDYSGLNDFERAIHRGFLCAGVENVPVTIIKETAQECMAKIKPVECDIVNHLDNPGDTAMADTLRRFRPQKQEWSEEEKDNIYILFCMIDSMDSISLPSGTLRISDEKRRELKEFVKRPSWKPSSVQMSMLLAVINDPNNASSESCHLALSGLYEELKKL